MNSHTWRRRVTAKTLTVASVGLLASAALGGTATAAPQGPNQTSTATAPASAAGTILAERGDVCFSGACGSATFSWDGSYRLSNVSMSVKDNKCDGNDVYIRLRIYDGSSNSGWATTKRRNSSGCSASYVSWSDLYVNNDARILGVKVEACVDDAGADTCRKSAYIAR